MLTLALVLSLWGDLQPGPHAVGVRQTDHYDQSRTFRTARTLDGKPRTGERARPIRVTVWYPAQPTNEKPMTFGDYARGEEAAILGLQGLARLDDQQRAKLLALPGRGVRDAKPASGKFPLILYSLKPSSRHTAALPAPITTADFLNAIAEDGVDTAIAAYRAEWKKRGTPPVDEATVNVTGYNLLFGANPPDGVKILALNAEAWPSSSNTWDSLADAWLAIGDRAKAIELAKKANALLAEEKSLIPQRRAAIQASIDAKLK